MSKRIIFLVLVITAGATAIFTILDRPQNTGIAEVSQGTAPANEPAADQGEYVIDQSDMYSVDASPSDAPARTLTPQEEHWITHMREEEKLARDVYTTLGAIWNMRIFMNIAGSEQTHTDAVKTLIERYGVADPVQDDTIGVFTIPEMQKLYDDLVAKGSLSLLDALTVGATIEDLDIHDLDEALAETNKADIRTVYANLQKGSRNHLRSFVRTIGTQGGTYSPSYISASVYNEIIASPQEKGRVQ